MKYVLIYSLDNNAEQHEIARCELHGSIAVCSGGQPLIKNLEDSGLSGLNQGERVFPRDGIKFLEALTRSLDSGYLTTSGILDTGG